MRSGLVLAIGASAGGIESLRALLPLLRPEWGIAFAILIHRPAVEDDRRLESLMNGWTSLMLSQARDGERIVPGRAVVAPADVHLTVEPGRYRLTTAPRENHARPAIDVLFRSVAENYGDRGGGLILSGLLDDGARGVARIHERGGLTIAQDPAQAVHADMPRAAIHAGAAHVRKIEEMPSAIADFATRRARYSASGAPTAGTVQLTRFTCPHCRGVLEEHHDNALTYYRCRVGRAFNEKSLDNEKSVGVEDALWTAIQVLAEQADSAERAVKRARANNNDLLAARLQARADRYRQRMDTVKDAVPKVNDAIEDSEARGATS